MTGLFAGEDIPEVIGLREFARWKGVNLKAIQKAIADGRLADAVIPSSQGDKLDKKWASQLWDDSRVPGNNNRFGELDCDRQKGDQGTLGLGDLESLVGEFKEDLTDARARLTSAQADKAELELQELQGKMHRAEDVEKVWAELLTAFRSAGLAMPNILAPEIAALTGYEDAGGIQKLLRGYMEEMLTELSRFRVDMVSRAAKARIGR